MLKKSIVLFLLKLLRLPLNILILSLTAKYYGVGIEKDAWLLASSTILMIDTALWGPLNDIFRTKFITLKETTSEKKAIESTKSLLSYIFAFSLIFVIIIIIFPQLISFLVAPQYEGKKLEMLLLLIRYLAPILLINQGILICSSILNAYDSFYLPEISAFCSLILNAILLIFLHSQVGIYALVISMYVSYFVLMIFLGRAIQKLGIDLFSRFNMQFEGFKIFFLFAAPLFFAYFLGQINALVEKNLASKLGVGAVSIVDFARKIPDMFNTIIGSVVLIVLVPSLTKAFIRNDSNEYLNHFSGSLRLGLLGIGFFCVYMFFGNMALYSFLFESKEISALQMGEIARLGQLYVIAFISIFLYIIFGMAVLSIQKNWWNAFAGSMAQVLTIGVNIALVDWFDFYIFPISLFFAHLFSFIILFLFFPYKKLSILFIIGKYTTLYIIVFVFMKLLFYIVPVPTFSSNLMELVFILLIQLFVFIPISLLFKTEEVFNFYVVVKRKILKFRM